MTSRSGEFLYIELRNMELLKLFYCEIHAQFRPYLSVDLSLLCHDPMRR